jgi:hypothetical protein
MERSLQVCIAHLEKTLGAERVLRFTVRGFKVSRCKEREQSRAIEYFD